MSFWRALANTVAAALRDRGLVILFVAAVPIYSFFYPLPYSTQTVRHLPLVVVDLDASPMSRDIVSQLSAVPSLRVAGNAASVDEASGAMASGQIAGIVVVPENFSRDAMRGTPTAVTVFGTGAYPVQDKAVLGSVGAVLQGVVAEVGGVRVAHGPQRTGDGAPPFRQDRADDENERFLIGGCRKGWRKLRQDRYNLCGKEHGLSPTLNGSGSTLF